MGDHCEEATKRLAFGKIYDWLDEVVMTLAPAPADVPTTICKRFPDIGFGQWWVPVQGRPRSRPLPGAAGVIVMLVLTGCAARVTEVTSVQASGPPPFEILVDVDVASGLDAADAKVAKGVSDELQSNLIEQLAASRVTAEPFVAGARHPDSVVLHVSITKADPGNLAERFVIGFGVGQAKLQARADLESTDMPGAYSITAFNTSGDSGYKPGLIVPGGAALATGNAVHLAIGAAAAVATNANGGLDKPTKATATAIVGQLKKYYVTVGWQWPGDA